MATVPSKEAVVVILDIGLGMTGSSGKNQYSNTSSTPIEDALKSVTLLYQQKLIYGKKDELGLVLIGTKDTKNNLQKDGYQHITVVCDIEEPKIETLKFLDNLGPGQSRGDIIDALIVGMDMLIQKTDSKKYQKRIFLVTNAQDPINRDDLKIVKDQFKKIEAKLNIIGIDFEDEEQLSSKPEQSLTLKQKNEIFLREFADSVEGVLVPVKEALEMMSFFRSQSVLQRTSYRGTLDVGQDLKIPVWGYIKTKIQILPRLNKISTLAQELQDPKLQMEVRQEKFYYSVTDPDNEITADELLKGYKYGKSLVPFSKIDEAALKFTAEKGLEVIGFTDKSQVPLYYNMANTEVLVSPPGDTVAESSLSALIHAMAETNQVALVRFVKKANSSPNLGVLTPQIKADYECLYYNTLPFTDDIRQYQFPPISPQNPLTRKQFQPTPTQFSAAQELIDSMDLMTADHDEEGGPIAALRPRYTYNPLLQHFYQCLHHRALQPGSAIPKLDPIIENYINPDEQILERAKDSISQFNSQFTLQKTTAFKDKSQVKYRWIDGMLVGEEITLDSYITDDGSEYKKRKINDFSDFSLDKLVSGYVNEVGTINPVQNFRDMLNRRDIDLVDKAIALMRSRIQQLVSDSLKDQYYQKAIECIKELRVGCIKESESDAFNSFLKEIRQLYESKKKDDFWQLIMSNSITLINEEESDSSDITVEESIQFLDKKSKQQPISQPTTNQDTDSVDDLFDQIE
ncbi:ATP-dependent DNA helicase [Tieghemostelium lacteum]|uniref:ATP-dependent DNA helicase n=1 Tax=Tieghemostelium lacteum TaxID=361077 RepID=A0A151ZH86_TIELA|nr:ATP-dependent DNA helicase [Tieghemostelium lacteum]|eukprot:KYQ93240.1 ATP-dependent DNA helicase [Tieghemostelium lacteum]